MREALSSLTPRGRVLLAAGVTAAVCAVVLAQEDLLRVGLLLTLLPLVAVVVMARSSYRITLHRVVEPSRINSGESARVSIRVTNEGSAPPGTVSIEDTVGYALGGRPSLRVGRLRHGASSEHQYRVSTDLRGQHTIGPAVLRVSDPLGLVEVQREFRSTAGLTVLPPIIPLSGAPRGNVGIGSDARFAPRGAGESHDTTVRTYRRGDDVRRVHWRSSARAGELMVRNEQSEQHAQATVLLDLRSSAHRGTGAASSFETAVRIATSLLAHLHQHDHAVRLLLGPEVLEIAQGNRTAMEEALSTLAGLTPSPDDTNPALSVAAEAGTSDLYLILGAIGPEEFRTWSTHTGTGTGPGGHRRVAFHIDVDAWSLRQHSGLPAQPLPTPWTSTVVTPRSSIAEAWRSVNR